MFMLTFQTIPKGLNSVLFFSSEQKANHYLNQLKEIHPHTVSQLHLVKTSLIDPTNLFVEPLIIF